MISASLLRSRTSVRTILVVAVRPTIGLLSVSADAQRSFSSKNKKGGFRPKRRPDQKYRPVTAGPKRIRDPSPGNDHKFVELGGVVKNAKDELDSTFGTFGGDLIRQVHKQRARMQENQLPHDDGIDEHLRMVDYYLAEKGTTEDLVGERRALAIDLDTDEERAEFLADLEKMAEEGRFRDLNLDDRSPTALREREKKKKEIGGMVSPFQDDDGDDDDNKDPDVSLDPNQLAHGDWSEMLIQVDRTIKLWRGGRLESYRALVIGGNLNGCGGFGIGKSNDPLEAVNKASRICKRNIFFVDRYQGNGLTRDLAGKQNSCKVIIRSTDNGLRGNELIREILKRFGITNAVSKAHGNRSPYNVVHATFKALMTHESLEDISLKRGKRIVSVDRAMRLQV